MKNIEELFGSGQLDKNVAAGYVSMRKHPTLPIYIYNYTQQTTFEDKWDDVTMTCRGLILDEDYNIISRPFRKFFNFNTGSRIETYESFLKDFSSPTITEKMDGSLGVLWRYNGLVGVSTRGSFDSEQARWATKFYNDIYSSFTWDEDVTPLFEIIYPDNRIVVNYSGDKRLVLLGVVRNEDGSEYTYEQMLATGFPDIVRSYVGKSLSDCVKESEMDIPLNSEGYVLKYDLHAETGTYPLRVKIKMLDYIRLHRLTFSLNNRVLWESLRSGKDPIDIMDELKRTPDDIQCWAAKHLSLLMRSRREVKDKASSVYNTRPISGTRKDNAIHFTKHPDICSICFAWLDNKSDEEIESMIWDKVRPQKAELFRRSFNEEW